MSSRRLAVFVTVLLLIAALGWPFVMGRNLDVESAMIGNPHAPFLPVFLWGIATALLTFIVIPFLVASATVLWLGTPSDSNITRPT